MMSTARILWLVWCGVWTVLWTIGAFVQFGFNPLFDLMVVASMAAMLLPVGKTADRTLSHGEPHQRLDGTWTQR